MSTPAQIRERAHRLRSVGTWTLVVGVFLALVVIVIAMIDTTLVGGPGSGFAACGSLFWPVAQVGPAAAACSAALGEQLTWAAGLGTVALALVVSGTVILVRTPRYLR